MFKKVLLIVFVLSLFPGVSFAEPIYTESVAYKVEVLEDGQVQVREATIIYRDGKEIAKTYKRHVLTPGADTNAEVKKVKDISAAAWTPMVIADYEAAEAAKVVAEIIE